MPPSDVTLYTVLRDNETTARWKSLISTMTKHNVRLLQETGLDSEQAVEYAVEKTEEEIANVLNSLTADLKRYFSEKE
jgi:hypothetical protein